MRSSYLVGFVVVQMNWQPPYFDPVILWHKHRGQEDQGTLFDPLALFPLEVLVPLLHTSHKRSLQEPLGVRGHQRGPRHQHLQGVPETQEIQVFLVCPEPRLSHFSHWVQLTQEVQLGPGNQGNLQVRWDLLIHEGL